MDLNVQQLNDHLDMALAPVYLVSGDEPLQVEESLTKIRAKAREKGYIERQVLYVERSFDWSQVTEQSSNMSLFGDKKILELRLPTGKPGIPGGKALQQYCEQLPDDVLLIIQSGKIEKATLKSKWVQAISQVGVFMRIWPLTGTDLVRWVQTRLKSEALSDDRQTAEYIASRVEGNMLAAAQEIEKMALLAIDNNDADQAWVSSQTKYNVFDLVDTILSGQRNKVIKILGQLQRESFAPNLVLWGLAELVRAVIYTSTQKRGKSKGVQNAFYYNKRNQLGVHANKFNREQLYTLLMKCGQVDQMIKGRASGDVWQSFTDVALKLAR
ncbi:MAG: DNA polymerase III subunit delta [Gammaproteobacteria bacterium]|nr:DNA polymerase III subunit delta [Gammaproteobacteria bacterium]